MGAAWPKHVVVQRALSGASTEGGGAMAMACSWMARGLTAEPQGLRAK
jgi:hypothetical protein